MSRVITAMESVGRDDFNPGVIVDMEDGGIWKVAKTDEETVTLENQMGTIQVWSWEEMGVEL